MSENNNENPATPDKTASVTTTPKQSRSGETQSTQSSHNATAVKATSGSATKKSSSSTATPKKASSGTETPQNTQSKSSGAVTPQNKSSGGVTPQKKSSGSVTPHKSSSAVTTHKSSSAVTATISQDRSNGAGSLSGSKTVDRSGTASANGSATTANESRSHSSASILDSEAETDGGGPGPVAALTPDDGQHEDDELRDLLQELDTDVVNPHDGFKALDDLFTSGKINETQYKDLQRKHKYLQSMFWSCLQNRSSLRDDIEETHACLEELKAKARQEALSAADAALAEDAAELHTVADLEGKSVDDLKKYLAMFDQQRKALENSIYQIRFKTRHMQEEKDQLQEKIDADNVSSSKIYLFSPTMLEKEIRELNVETRLRKQEIKNLKEDISSREHLIPQREAKIAKLNEKLQVLKDEKEELIPKKILITRDADRDVKLTTKLRKQLDTLNADIAELIGKLKESTDATQKLEGERNELIKDMDKEYKVVDARSKESQNLSRDADRCRERSALLMDEKNRAETRLATLGTEIRQERINVRDMGKAVERVDRNLRSVEETVKGQRDQVMASRIEMEKLSKRMVQQTKAASELPMQRKALQKDVDLAHQETTALASITATEQLELKRLAKERATLIRSQETQSKQLDSLVRKHSNLIRQRDTNARVYRKLSGDVEKNEDELRNRITVVGKFKKKFDETEKNTRLLGERYEMAKKERDEMSAQLNISLTNCDELQKKIEILHSQQDTMLSRKLELERQHSLTRAATMKCILDKTMIQSTMNQEKDQEKELEQQRDQLDMMISCNQMSLNALKEIIMDDLETYKKVVVDRNERGLLLVEREEEVCAFQEKISLQQLFIDRGYARLDTCEKDILELKKIIGTEKHHIKCLGARKQEMDGMQAWLAATRCEMRDLNARTLSASDQVETPSLRQCRMLPGKPEEPADVELHLSRMELQLYEAELRLLERQMVSAQLERLVDRVQTQIDTSKADSERLAKRVNTQSRMVISGSRKLMASAAEAAVAKTEARRLCELRQRLQLQLDVAQQRMADGLPPFPADRAVQVPSPLPPPSPLPAPPPRPTQYLPQSEDSLPLPKPYGAFSPFKPQAHGGRFRRLERMAKHREKTNSDQQL